MRVPDIFLSNVGFVGEAVGGDFSSDAFNLVGTGFVIALVLAPNVMTYCFVTAKHIIRRIPNTQQFICVNKKDGGIVRLNIAHDWRFHPDDSVDVAVAHIFFDPSAEVSGFAIEDLFDPANPGNFGIGDEVFFPSLFQYAFGDEDKLQPLVRHGNLAMLPSKQVQTQYGYADVYLVEARSIAGISGSPVYIRETIQIRASTKLGEKHLIFGSGATKLLGMMHGHWDICATDKNELAFEADARRGVNIGIAMVVPASKILEIINLPRMVAFREEQLRQCIKKTAPCAD